MRHSLPGPGQRSQRWPGHARGAANWVLVAGLVLMASLASAWSLRAVWLELLGTQARGQAQQARWAAQAALASGQAVLQQALGSEQAHTFLSATHAGPCPPTHPEWPAPRWQCAQLSAAALGTQATLGESPTAWALQLLLARDVRDAPHIWQLLAQAQLAGQTPEQTTPVGKGRSTAQAQLREQVLVPVLAPAPADPVGAALWLNGCWRADTGSDWQICPQPVLGGSACAGASPWPAVYSLQVPDGDGDGQISATERSACLALGPAHLPAGGALLAAATVGARTPCSRAVWRSLFGDTREAQLQAWSDAQAHNGLHAGSVPSRSVYWIDSPADWGQSLGSPEAPVLLVFSAQACATRCPRLLAGVQIHGTIYLDTDCDDRKLQGWQGARIDGLLAVEGGLTSAGGWTRVRSQPYARAAWQLHWPDGQSGASGTNSANGPTTPGLRPLPGSHRAGTP